MITPSQGVLRGVAREGPDGREAQLRGVVVEIEPDAAELAFEVPPLPLSQPGPHSLRVSANGALPGEARIRVRGRARAPAAHAAGARA